MCISVSTLRNNLTSSFTSNATSLPSLFPWTASSLCTWTIQIPLGEGEMFTLMPPDPLAGSFHLNPTISFCPFSVQEMILLELLSKETSSYSRILFMLEKLMPANSLVSCSIFLGYLILGNWPNLCPTVGAWQRERDKERRKRFVGVRDSLCMCLHTYVSWHKAGLCGF